MPWSAAGYARGLKAWIADNVTAVHGIEFSIHHPAGFAGTCDALIDVKAPVDGAVEGEPGTPVLTICDWKTSERARSESMLRNYIHQAGAYSLGLESLTGIRAQAGAIVVARRSGSPQVRMLTRDELDDAESDFLERCAIYFAGQEQAA